MPGRRSIPRPLSMRPRSSLTVRSPSSGAEFPNSASFAPGQQLPDSDPMHFTDMHQQPTLSVMSKIAFEAFFMVYLLVALVAQYIYIFKTVWWYPTALPPSTNTVNFHLIDKNLTTFLFFLFSQRFLWALMWNYLKPSSDNMLYTGTWASLCIVVFGFWFFELFGYALLLLEHIQFYKLLFLLYPLLLWIPYNFFVEEGVLKYIANLLQRKDSKQRLSSAKATGITSDGDAVKGLDAKQVRCDVQQLCKDFNCRFAEIVFYSLTYSYYAGLVPMFFTKSCHSYNLLWSVQHTALILVNSFLMLATYLLPAQYLQTLSRSAMLLGGYSQVRDPVAKLIEAEVDVQDWTASGVFPRGSFVKYKSNTYRACGKFNTAIPDDRTHAKFFVLFYKPLKVIDWQLAILLAVICFQIYAVVFSSHWDHIVAPAILQFFSYYVLRTVLRDRIVLNTFFNLYRRL